MIFGLEPGSKDEIGIVFQPVGRSIVGSLVPGIFGSIRIPVLTNIGPANAVFNDHGPRLGNVVDPLSKANLGPKLGAIDVGREGPNEKSVGGRGLVVARKPDAVQFALELRIGRRIGPQITRAGAPGAF